MHARAQCDKGKRCAYLCDFGFGFCKPKANKYVLIRLMSQNPKARVKPSQTPT